MRRFSLLPLALLLAVSLSAGCDGDPGSDASTPVSVSATGTSPTPPPSPTPSPTEPALPQRPPPHRGKAGPTCTGGWTTPASDSPEFTDPLGIIRRTAGVDLPFEVVEIRMFVGPESPPSVGEGAKGYLQDIRRWYVKLYTPDDLTFQGRFLVEQRVFGRGVAAVAPYDTRGFRSPDWRAFQFDSADADARTIPGLPGTWSGEEYDFVKGGAGLDLPGLPEAVAGCLDGT